MTVELTDKVVKELPTPAAGNKVTYDSEVRGLGVRVTAAGARAYVFNYRVKGAGTERRITIGDASDWKLKAARDKARELRRRVDDGEDPMGNLHAQRAAPTVNDLADRFEAEHLTKRREKTGKDYRAMLRLYVRPELGNRKVAEVKRADVEKLHGKIAQKAPYAANRTVAMLSKIFSLAIAWELRADNPAKGIERAPEQKRERFLTGAEIARLSEVLADHPEKASANVVRLLLLTGARRGEVLSATWNQFDLSAGVWLKPAATTKQKKDHRLPLSAPALQLLQQMKAEADQENTRRQKDGLKPLPFLFPGADGKPLQEIKHFWAAVCRKAGLSELVEKTDANGKVAKGADGKPAMVWQPTVRIHDLRHTHASILASLGLSLPIIGALLGHTQAATTARYAHLLDDPLRAATERLGAIVTGAGREGAEVVPMLGGRRP